MRPPSIKTKALVIKRTNYRDADRIVTLFSEDLGKVTAIAKGVRKMASKNRSHLELLNFIKVELVDSHGIYIITHVETLHSFLNIKDNYKKINEAYYVLEILDKLMPEQEENVIIYQLVLKTLYMLELDDSPHLLNAYNVKIIKILGYYGEANMKIMLPPHAEEASFASKSSNRHILDYLHALVSSKYETLEQINVTEETVKSTALALKCYTEEILERELKSFKLPEGEELLF